MMTVEQIWVIIAIVALIVLIIGVLGGGFFFSKEQRAREQREYKPLRDSHPSVLDRRVEGNNNPLISWGVIESEPSSTSRIRWGNDNEHDLTGNSVLPSVSIIYTDEFGLARNSDVDEMIVNGPQNNRPTEKLRCPICKREIDMSAGEIVICSGGCETQYHSKCLEEVNGRCPFCHHESF